MRSIRRSGAAVRSGSHAEARRAAEPNAAQLKRLRRWAVGFAVPVSAMVVVPVVFGLDLSTVYLLPALIVMFFLFRFANRWTVKVMHQDVQSPPMPWLRIAIGVGAALVVAHAVIFWKFGGDIETAQGSAAVATWDEEMQGLRNERPMKLEVADRQLPTVEQDPDVVRLERQLDEANNDFREAKRDELCELDGTCGTRIPGVGKAYNDKAAYRVQVEEKITEISAKIESVKAVSRGRIDQLSQERNGAKGRVAEIDRQLEQLGPNRPEMRGRAAASFSVAQQEWHWVVLVFGAFLAVDLLAFYLVVRRVCHREVGRVWFKETMAEQSERDDRSARGARRIEDVPPAQWKKFFRSGAGE